MTMRLVHDDSLEALADLLRRELPDDGAHNLFLGIAARVAAARPGTAFGVRVEDGGVLAGAFLWTPPHRVLLSSRDGGALELLLDHLATHPLSPRGVHAEPEHAERFARRWSEREGGGFRVAMRERVYELCEVAPYTAAEGQLRGASPGDEVLLAAWMCAFSVEAGIAVPSEAEACAEVGRRTAAGDLFVWEVEGAAVAMASFARPTPACIALNFVYTDPAARCRGYAGSAVGEMSRRQLASGRRATCLHADLDNPASNRAYLRVGFRPVRDAWAIDLVP